LQSREVYIKIILLNKDIKVFENKLHMYEAGKEQLPEEEFCRAIICVNSGVSAELRDD
jgi:hypothetical protein